MREILKKIMAAALAVSVAVTGIPVQTIAAGTVQTKSPSKLELMDEYIRVTVSGKNGGFLIDTLEGNKLKKSDNNKFLLYPAEDYDTSYTSFCITRTNGTKEEYIFGRDYGFLGMDSSAVELGKQGNTLTAVWSVKDLRIEQRLSLLDESASQHGMVSIGYSVTTEREDVANVKLRILYDTALGYQDYGVYELPDRVGDYTHIRKETLLDNKDGQAFAGNLFAVDDPGAPKITAYTVNAAMDGRMVKPYQAAFGHWNHLASTVFDFTPDETLDFTNPYNADYMTADSAYALYYDMGGLTKDTPVSLNTYYGVYSNSTVSDEEKVAVNFPALPATMTLNETKDAYISQVEGGRPGDVSLRLSVENISASPMEHMTVVIRTQNQVNPYRDWYENELYGEDETYTTVVDDYQVGETEQLEAFFRVSPLAVSEYRRFEVLCYDAAQGETLTDAKLLGSREFYLFCPGVLGEKVSFHSMDPQMVYTEGTKNLYLSGQNFRLLRDKTAYVTYLHSLSGGKDVIVPAKNVVVDDEKNTMYLVVESTLDPGSYQVVFDWTEEGKENTTSEMLQFLATDKPEYLSPVYGIVTIEKEHGYTAENPRYRLMAYGDEEEYSQKMKDPNNRVLLEFRGNFSLWYDEAGNITEAKAVSLEDVEGKISNTINISNCLDVEAGSVSILVEEPGTDNQVIETNIDGKVYTTNSRTKVWDGVCAISSIENGSVSTLLQYTSDADVADNLENSVANTNAITLIWPGAASGVQTLAGMFLEFRYCQFGMMALEDGMVTDATPKRRVIAFGAEISPDFLVPSNFKWGERQTSTLEAVQLKIAKSNYTAEQLRDVQERYAADQAAWEEAEAGSLALYVHDILFGGGFIGFNASVEVEIPGYAEGLPAVAGTLGIKIMPMDDWWEVGVSGSANFEVFEMEASLRLKSYNGIPVPDNLYFYVGGVTPGINVDGMGIFWIQGLGGGFDSLYDTLFVSSQIPPLTLMLSGQFALFALMQARADLNLSMRGFDVGLSNIGVSGVQLIQRMGLGTYWYPKMKLNASMSVNILNIIDGGGYLILEENQKNGNIFWEGFVTASVKTPKIPLIGSITIGGADLGINAAKIWGALHVLKMDMGVTYYWGGDVDFSFGKYDAPEPTYPLALFADIPVYTDEETGKVLYMSMGTNGTVAAKARIQQEGGENADSASNAGGEPAAQEDSAGPEIVSSAERMTHTIRLGEYTGNSDMALAVQFTANSRAEAEKLAKGLELTDAQNQPYEWNWLDTTCPADEQPDANALLSYDEDTKKASVTVSFTEESFYQGAWSLESKMSCDLTLHELRRLPGLESAEYTYQENGPLTVNWSGSLLEEIDTLAVYAVKEEDELYSLYETKDKDVIAGNQAEIVIPDTLPGGSYTLRVVASSEKNSVNDIVDVENPFVYVNPNQPKAPRVEDITLGGDYSLDVDVTKQEEYDGYIAEIYEQKTTGDKTVWETTDFAGMWIGPDESGSLPDTITVGGRYETTVWLDEDGNAVSADEAENRTDLHREQKTVGLEAGKTYCVGLSGYRTGKDGQIYLSEEVKSGSVEMREPSPATLQVSVRGAMEFTDYLDTETSLDTVNSNSVTVDIQSDQPVSGTWTLDDAREGKWQASNTGQITFDKLPDGEHILVLRGENEAGDGVQEQYRFQVDTTPPRLQFSSPSDGAFFGQTVRVAGLSEPRAKIYIQPEGNARQEVLAAEDGSFTAQADMDLSALEQKITVYAEDEAGNRSRQYEFKLTNELLGNPDAQLAVYMNGIDYTGQTIAAGMGGILELRVEAGEQSLAIPSDSNVGRQAEWELHMMSGTASVDGQELTTDSQADGILLVTLDQQQAGLVLGGNRPMSVNTYAVTLPTETIGYQVSTSQELIVADGGSFAFTVEIAEGYSALEDFAVKANGVPVEGKDGVYTISDIHAPKNITVTGVADITAPEVEITIGNQWWKEFLNVITFGTFFRDNQDVKVKAEDKGSGVSRTEYYISDKAITLDEIMALSDNEWTECSGTFTVGSGQKQVVYVRALDQAGNVKYVSSDGLVHDDVAPAITGLENDAVYYGDKEFTVAEDNLQEIRVDGKVITAEDGVYKIPADNANHTVEAIDKAGNCTSYTVSVYRNYVVQFVADGVVIDTRTVHYGDNLLADQFPDIPVKQGYDQTAPRWDKGDLSDIKENQTVTAIYTKNPADEEKPQPLDPADEEKPQPLDPADEEKPQPANPEDYVDQAINIGLKASWKKNYIRIAWGKVAGADGYEILAGVCGKPFGEKALVKTIKSAKRISAKVRKVNGKKLNTSSVYKFRVRAYCLKDGKKQYLKTSRILHAAGPGNRKYTNVKRIKVKRSKYKLLKGKTARIRAKAVRENGRKKLLPKWHGDRLRYWSTNQKVAYVTKKGRIKAKGKGKCYIYISALNGVYKRIRITVK